MGQLKSPAPWTFEVGTLTKVRNPKEARKKSRVPNKVGSPRGFLGIGKGDPILASKKGIKGNPGINRLILAPQEAHIRPGEVLAPSMSAHSHPWGWTKVPKGLNAVPHLNGYASWVQNVVRQFGPYLSRGRWKVEESWP